MPNKPVLDDPDDGHSVLRGERARTLADFGDFLRGCGASLDQILAQLFAYNRWCSPPLPNIEVQRIALEAAKYEPADPRPHLTTPERRN